MANELASVLRILGHPDRVRIIDELSREEKDVKTLLNDLALPGPRVSQHLGLLRAYRIVDERRDGRHRIYRLIQPQLASWLLRGLDIVEGRSGGAAISVAGGTA